MSKELAALTLTLAVHVVGAVVIVWGLMGDERVDWRSLLWPRDADDGDGGRGPDADRTPGGPGAPSGLPLPDAVQAPVRLREPARLGDRYPRPERRPVHTPQPQPQPQPQRDPQRSGS